jgi:hypothetical protein
VVGIATQGLRCVVGLRMVDGSYGSKPGARPVASVEATDVKGSTLPVRNWWFMWCPYWLRVQDNEGFKGRLQGRCRRLS